jgi:hypothetical protein
VSQEGEPIDTFDGACKDQRTAIKAIAESVKQMHQAPVFKIQELYPGQHDEIHANITLTYRHLEDAAMRLGKAIQAYDHGISVYDREKGPSYKQTDKGTD